MTRTYALKRLLEHGPLTVSEIVDCSGWTLPQAAAAIQNGLVTGVVAILGNARGQHGRVSHLYGLA